MLILHMDMYMNTCPLVAPGSNVPLEGLDAWPQMAFAVLRLVLCLPPE